MAVDWSTFDAIMERLAAGFGELSSRVPLIMENPRAYPREAMVLVLIAALALLLLVVVGLIVSDVTAARRERPRLRVAGRGASILRTAAAVLVVAAAAVVIASLLPLSPSVSESCTTCHQLQPAVAAWQAGSHPGVSCLGCHARPGLTGAVEASFSGLARFVGAESRESSASSPASRVYQDGCLACHGAVEDGVVGAAVLMRHSDVIEAGYACTSCHRALGHEELASLKPAVSTSMMATCLVCHDGETAPAECDTCHVQQPSDAASGGGGGLTALAVTCEGCHQAATEERCVACHGLVLPHPVEFMGQHAALSAADPDLCAGCHETARPPAGCGCHTEVNLHGTYTAWFPQHGAAALETAGRGCACHDAAFCGFCHESSPL